MSNGPFACQFDFQITAVPEPSRVLLLAASAVLLLVAAKRGAH